MTSINPKIVDAPSAAELAASVPITSLMDDASKKIRKPYTITKSRESWTDQEHEKFIEALQIFDRDWKKIEAYVGTKTVIQIRSHAQKYFLKVQKNGTREHVPPPRPKRKAAHPYPQKASKIVPLISQPANAFQAAACLLEPGCIPRNDSPTVLQNSSSWSNNSSHPHKLQNPKGPPCALMANNSYSSAESPSTSPVYETSDHGSQAPSLRATPDFSQVYGFIGTVFDPNSSGQLQTLKEMDPIDVETVLLLMKNLSVNLTSPDFEDHRKLLASYEATSAESGNANDTSKADETTRDPVMIKVE
nr:LHY protein [Allium sativum]